MKQSRFLKAEGQTGACHSSATATSSTSSAVMPASLVGKTLTEELLSSELSNLDQILEQLRSKLVSEATANQSKDNKDTGGEEKEEEDELVAYMKANDTIKAQQEVRIIYIYHCMYTLYIHFTFLFSSLLFWLFELLPVKHH